MTEIQLTEICAEFAIMLVSYGAEIYRTEDTIRRICTAYGHKNAEIYVTPANFIITVKSPDGVPITNSKNVSGRNTTLDRVGKLNELSRFICRMKPDAETIQKHLDTIRHRRTYSQPVLYLSYAAAGAAFTLFFGGGDLLLIFFALTTANLCLILAATTCNSPYAAMGANREMLQTMAYEPMVLLTAVGFYLATGSFKVSDIVRSSGLPPIVYLPGVFCGFLFILTIKLRKHPFDLSTSHHAHQEMVKGLTTEFNGVTLLIVEVSHWYENVFLMGIIALFFINGKPWSYALAAVAVVLSYFLEILIDNTNARLKWQRMFKTTWAVTMIIGVINIFVLQVLKGV